jgi:hypothetical protein
MADTRDLIPQAERYETQIYGLWSAKIATTATSLTQLVYIVIPDIDPASLWGPCEWMPRVIPEQVNVAESGESQHLVTIPKIIYPTKDDKCLIAFDNRREVWVVVWWPS